MSRIGKRVVLGAVMIAVLAAILWGDWRLERWIPVGGTNGFLLRMTGLKGLPVAGVIAAIAVAAFFELTRLLAGASISLLPTSGLLGTLAVATSTYWAGPLSLASGFPLPREVPFLAFALVVAGAFAEQMIRYRKEDALRRIAFTVLAVGYLGVCAAVVLEIRVVHGVPALVLFLVAAKFTDIGAYFTGTAIGRHKLIPWLSPGKSWEGLAGGLIAGAAACAAGAWAFGDMLSLSVWQAAVFGAVVGLAGQFADLCESLLKRSAGLKDSGAVLPEFGGVLDIIDSVLLSAPVATILLAVFQG
jgi:phosphatidate cytidylyltransferase